MFLEIMKSEMMQQVVHAYSHDLVDETLKATHVVLDCHTYLDIGFGLYSLSLSEMNPFWNTSFNCLTALFY